LHTSGQAEDIADRTLLQGLNTQARILLIDANSWISPELRRAGLTIFATHHEHQGVMYILLDRDFIRRASVSGIALKILHELGAIAGRSEETNRARELIFMTRLLQERFSPAE
jgi:hypothetical protein